MGARLAARGGPALPALGPASGRSSTGSCCSPARTIPSGPCAAIEAELAAAPSTRSSATRPSRRCGCAAASVDEFARRYGYRWRPASDRDAGSPPGSTRSSRSGALPVGHLRRPPRAAAAAGLPRLGLVHALAARGRRGPRRAGRGRRPLPAHDRPDRGVRPHRAGQLRRCGSPNDHRRYAVFEPPARRSRACSGSPTSTRCSRRAPTSRASSPTTRAVAATDASTGRPNLCAAMTAARLDPVPDPRPPRLPRGRARVGRAAGRRARRRDRDRRGRRGRTPPTARARRSPRRALRRARPPARHQRRPQRGDRGVERRARCASSTTTSRSWPGWLDALLRRRARATRRSAGRSARGWRARSCARAGASRCR